MSSLTSGLGDSHFLATNSRCSDKETRTTVLVKKLSNIRQSVLAEITNKPKAIDESGWYHSLVVCPGTDNPASVYTASLVSDSVAESVHAFHVDQGDDYVVALRVYRRGDLDASIKWSFRWSVRLVSPVGQSDVPQYVVTKHAAR